MKRMNEVFELPVSASRMGHEHAQEILKSGQSHYCLEDGEYWMASDAEHIEAAVQAINHVDALADALADLLYEISNGGATRYTTGIAVRELAAYRGEK